VAQLLFDSGAQLAVEPAKGEMLVYLVHPVPHVSTPGWVDALKRCHVRRRGLWPIQVGGRHTPSGAELVVLTRLPERALTPQRLEEAVQSVLRWRDAWHTGVH
jgi:type III secretion system chaperone SycN